MKFALITGAGSGIGRATAILFSQHEFEVILVGRTEEKLKSTKRALAGSSHTFACDLTDASAAKRLGHEVQALVEGFTLSVLVNNAGIYDEGVLSDDQLWREQWEHNCLAPVRLTRLLWPLLKPGGSVVNVSSTLGLRPSVGVGAYAAAKAAMINWTQTAALEGAPEQIRVNCVCPGIVQTPIHKLGPSGSRWQALDQLQPLKRTGRPEEVAQAILYFAHSSWTTGSTLCVDGGIQLI